MRRKHLQTLIFNWDKGYKSFSIGPYFHENGDLYKQFVKTLDALMYLERRGWKIDYQENEDDLVNLHALFNLHPDYTTESMVVKINSSRVEMDELIEEKVGMSFTQALQDRDWAKLKLISIRISEHQYNWRKKEDNRIL